MRKSLKIIVRIAIIGIFCASIFLFSGRIDWIKGWLFIGLLIVGQSISTLYLWRRDPELVRSRLRVGKGTKAWDKALLGVWAFLFLATVYTAALDEKHQWSTMSNWFWLVGCILYAFFNVLITWAMTVNTHFEKTVRIQSDRDHRVIDSGPYKIVRHPGYLASIVGLIFAVPFLLGSWWALIPASLTAACLVFRTALEDQTLQRELPGYKDYAQKVPYRLLPPVW